MCNECRLISRQDFLRAALALTALPLLRQVPAFAAAPSPDSVEVSEIAPGVFVHQGVLREAATFRELVTRPEVRGYLGGLAPAV